MIDLTQAMIDKALEIISNQENASQISGLRIAVVGGGCSGFSYSLAFEKSLGPLDKVYEFAGSDGRKLAVFVDQASMLYLDGVRVDYVETLEGAGFKFDNPNTKTTCGCGSSFQV